MIYIIVIIMTLLGAIAGLFLKKAAGFNDIMELIKNKYFYYGAAIYVLAAILNIIALEYLPYSVVLPLTAITYVWTIILAHYSLGEIITNKKIIGVLLIVIGAICIAV